MRGKTWLALKKIKIQVETCSGKLKFLYQTCIL